MKPIEMSWEVEKRWDVEGQCVFFFFFFFLHFSAIPVAYLSSQARGWIGATAAGLYHSHSNMGSKPYLWSTPHLMAMPDP